MQRHLNEQSEDKARGRHFRTVFSLLPLLLASEAYASESFEYSLVSYVARMSVALALLLLLGYAATRYCPKYFTSLQTRSHLKVIDATRLGKDSLYIVKTGPTVSALLLGRESRVVAQWSEEEWEQYEQRSDTEKTEE